MSLKILITLWAKYVVERSRPDHGVFVQAIFLCYVRRRQICICKLMDRMIRLKLQTPVVPFDGAAANVNMAMLRNETTLPLSVLHALCTSDVTTIHRVCHELYKFLGLELMHLRKCLVRADIVQSSSTTMHNKYQKATWLSDVT